MVLFGVGIVCAFESVSAGDCIAKIADFGVNTTNLHTTLALVLLALFVLFGGFLVFVACGWHWCYQL